MEDQELLEKLRHEDSRNFGFNQLVRKYQEKIYWHIRKMVIDHDDANDVVRMFSSKSMITFISLEKTHNFTPGFTASQQTNAFHF